MKRIEALLIGILVATTVALPVRAATVTPGSDRTGIDYGPATLDDDFELKQSQGRRTVTTYPAGTTSSARGGDSVTITATDIGTTTPAPGAIPVAGTDSKLAPGWMPTSVVTSTATGTANDNVVPKFSGGALVPSRISDPGTGHIAMPLLQLTSPGGSSDPFWLIKGTGTGGLRFTFNAAGNYESYIRTYEDGASSSASYMDFGVPTSSSESALGLRVRSSGIEAPNTIVCGAGLSCAGPTATGTSTATGSGTGTYRIISTIPITMSSTATGVTGSGNATYIPVFTTGTGTGTGTATEIANSPLRTAGSNVIASASISAPSGTVSGFALKAGAQGSAIGQVTLYSEAGGSVSLYGPTGLAVDNSFTLPNADGVSADCLKTNGSGVLYFATCPTGSGGTITGSGTAGTLAKWASASSLNNATSTDVINTLGYTPVSTARTVCGQALSSDVSCNYTPDNNSVTAQGTPVAATFDNRGRATGFQSITPAWIGAVPAGAVFSGRGYGPSTDQTALAGAWWIPVASVSFTAPSTGANSKITVQASVPLEAGGGNALCNAKVFLDGTAAGNAQCAQSSELILGVAKATLPVTCGFDVASGTSHTVYIQIAADASNLSCTAYANTVWMTIQGNP